jgi:signal transduction histidine kinase/CheY-like chemotaxis protein
VSSFIAVAGFGPPPESDAGQARTAERRAATRRLSDATIEAACTSSAAPLMLALALVGAAAGMLPPSLPCVVWSAGASAAWLAWLAPVVLHRRGSALVADRRRLRRIFMPCAASWTLALAALPWLAPLPDAAGTPWLLAAMLAGVAFAAAGSQAPLPGCAALAAALPLSPALAAAMHLPNDTAAAQSLLVGAALCTACALHAAQGYRAWSRNARAQIARDDRIRILTAERDEALKADQDKTRFLANASHDLRQPMHAIGLFAATLEKRLRGSAEEPLIRNVMRSIEGLERSFNAMLDISRLDAGTVEPNVQHFPLRDVFRRLHMHFAGQAELAGLCLRFSPGGKFVSSDPQLLERILGNLIQNALKYTENGGVVVVARSTATHTNVEVWDTGTGIAPDDLPRVFEEFYQVGRSEGARAKGLGMGLAIVKRLAQLLGHRLTVASRPGKGTMFRLGVAIGGLADIRDATMAADTLPMPVSEPRTVLVVEDEEPIREGLRGLLEEWGYVAVVAASAPQAERALQALQAPPDLILSDLHLSGGADGIAAIEAVRRHCGQAVPAILVTGDTSHEELRRATESGHPVLFKPVQPRKLYNALRGLG